MAVRDIEAFMRERAAVFDSNLDVSVGSPFDAQVIQPLVRRLGTDPFSVDLPTFLDERIRQAFPELAVGEGDAITDLLIKPITLLWDPIIREVRRVKQQLSFQDPDALTIEEAEALGANLFAERAVGAFAIGQARVFFVSPQSVAISPINFVSSKGGLRFFPSEAQTIRNDEMLLNQAADGTYYFDINVTAESPGSDYNLGPNELVSIANIDAAVRVTNLRRFAAGEDEDTAAEFIAKARGELTERSMVTLRGVSAQLRRAFPEIRRLNVVGYRDPEMNRDIIEGGSLGAVIGSGVLGTTEDDGENKAPVRRFSSSDPGVDFTTLIGPVSGAISGYFVTIFGGADDPSAPAVVDYEISQVLDIDTLELKDQALKRLATGLNWMIRRKSLTLSNIPGGILFPNGPTGTLTIKDGEVHIGGMTDFYIGGSTTDETTRILDAVSDDVVELSGIKARAIDTSTIDATPAATSFWILTDLVLGTNYGTNDDIFRLFEQAGVLGLTLQIIGGSLDPNVANYRVLKVRQGVGFSPEFDVLPVPPSFEVLGGGPPVVLPPVPLALYRWRLFNEINIDLVDPKETRLVAADLVTFLSSNIVNSGSIPPINYNDYGVGKGDFLRISSGPDVGDYEITAAPLGAGDQLQLKSALSTTLTNVKYSIIRKNTDGGLSLPLVRIKKIELLDTTSQPVGTVIPYAKAVDIQSRAFQNPARGVKHEITDLRLGLMSLAPAVNFGNPGGETITFRIFQRDGSSLDYTTLSIPINATVADVVAAFNGVPAIIGAGYAPAFVFNGDRVAFRPTGAGLHIIDGTWTGVPIPGILTLIFGTEEKRTTADIRSDFVDALGGWDALSPKIDFTSGEDIVQIVSGNQRGYYGIPFSGPLSTGRTFPRTLPGLLPPTPNPVLVTALIVDNVDDTQKDETTRQFAPEINIRGQLGSRSLGSARMFFIEPTSVQVGANTIFSAKTSTGVRRFIPSPELNYQLLPALPSNNRLDDGSIDPAGLIQLTSPSSDFLFSGILPGDLLTVDYIPLYGTVNLSNPQGGLTNTTLVFSFDDGPNIVVTFFRDDISLAPTELTLQGIADQINGRIGEDIATIVGVSPNARLKLKSKRKMAIRTTGTANALVLGSLDFIAPAPNTAVEEVTNISPQSGTYRISTVASNTLDIESVFPSASPTATVPLRTYLPALLDEQGFTLSRRGIQRITTTIMAAQQAEASLYYADFELVSEGIGDAWNIAADIQMTAEGYVSDGYYLTTDNDTLTFSLVEKPKLIISKSILEEGVDDAPANATQIVGQNLLVTYERSQLVADAQAFALAETERVVNENPLVRHLIPHFVRLSLTYTGGSREDIILSDINKYILNRFPADPLEVGDINGIIKNRGASYVRNPIDLIALVHQIDRSIQAARSQDSLTTGRLASFIPDIINVVRDVL